MKMTRMFMAIRAAYAVRSGLVMGILALEVDAVETLDAAVRGLYKPIEGTKRFRLDVSGIPEPEDTTALKAAAKKERESAQASAKLLKEMQDKYKDIDPEEVRKLMASLEDDGEKKLLKEGKVEEVVLARTEKLRKTMEKQVADALAVAAKEKAARLKSSERVLDNEVRAIVTKAGVHVSAIDDALLRARGLFSLGDDGTPVQVGEDGVVVLGKDAKTPYSVAEWIEGMKESAPHWFPAGSSGSGGKGNGSGAAGAAGSTITRAAFDALDQDARAQWFKDHKGGKVTE